MTSLPEHLSSAPVGREPLAREVMAEHQRNRVIGAAAEVFAKRGYPATTVDHIVAAARVGVGSFYSLFDGKEDCFLQVYDQIVAAGRERIAAAIPADRPWPEQAYAALRELVGLIAAEPLQARIALVEVQTAGPAALARSEATFDAVTPLLRRGRERSPVAAELPATLEDAILGGLLWLLQQRIVQGELGNIEALLPELVQIVVEPYLGEDEAGRLIVALQSA